MKDLLSALPCFIQIEKITALTPGLSQSCFKVCADNKVYFAKTVTSNIEVPMAICASKSGLSPVVIYHDQNWLICHYIDANNLAQSTINTEEKIKQAIKLMVQCHQLQIKPAELMSKDIIHSLINNANYSAWKQTKLLELAELLISPLNSNIKAVSCHGDLNFSNVLMSQSHNTWLVDYECACTAPIEYDLAMLIAVNNLASDKIAIIIEQYEVQSSVNIDLQLLNHYLFFCYFINALWYFNTYHQITDTKSKQTLLDHSQKQWCALQASIKANNSPLLSRLSIKFTNILTTFDLSN